MGGTVFNGSAGGAPRPNVTSKSADVRDALDAVWKNLNGGGVMANVSAMDVVGVKANSAADFEALVSAVVFNTLAVLCTLMLFAVLARAFPMVYAHRAQTDSDAHDPTLPALEGGLLSWLGVASSVGDAKVVEVAGLDGLMLVEFFCLCRRLLGTVGPVTISILCPMHFCLGNAVGVDKLGRLGIGTLTDRARLEWTSALGIRGGVLCLYWVHAAVVWFVVLSGLRLVMDAQERFLERRFTWLMGIPPPRATTLMVEGIPREHCSDAALRAYFVRILSEEAVGRAYVVRHTQELRRRVARQESLAQRLQQAEAQWDAAGRDPAQRPVIQDWLCFRKGADAIETCSRQLADARSVVAEERERVTALASSGDASTCSRAGFVTFSSRRWCRLASREQFRADSSELRMRMPPDPADVVYADLAKDPAEQAGSVLVSRLLTFGVFCAWMPLVFAISGMTNLSTLQQYVPFIKTMCEQFPAVVASIEGVLATMTLKIFMAFLPSMLMAIIASLGTPKSGSWAQLHLQGQYYSFLLVFVLLVTAINRSILAALEELIKEPTKVLMTLADSLPGASHFYINYLVLGWFTLSIGLLRVVNLAKFLAWRSSGEQSAQEAWRRAEPEDQDYDGIGARMAKASLMMTITLVFCTCSPEIVAFAWVYFAAGERVYRYLVVYAETKKPDLGGDFWVLALKQIVLAIGLFAALMAGILYKAGSLGPAAVAALSLAYVAKEYVNFENLVWESLPFEAVAEADRVAFRKTVVGQAEQGVGHYVQSECAEGGCGPCAVEDLVAGEVGAEGSGSGSQNPTQKRSDGDIGAQAKRYARQMSLK